MSLVAYDYSDDEEEEEENQIQPNVTINKDAQIEQNIDESNEKTIIQEESEEECKKVSKESSENLIKLPTSNTLKSIGIDIPWSVLDKHRTQPIRITIPPLEKEKPGVEEEPKKKPSIKGSGLFAVLPKPKSELVSPATSLKPSQLQRKLSAKLKQKKKMEKPDAKPTNDKTKAKESDSEDEIESDSFFFLPESNISADEIPIDDLPPMPPIQEEIQPEADTTYNDSEMEIPIPQIPEEPTESQPLELDDEALAKLCGTRDRRGRKQEMVDVNGSALVGDPREWLTKELSKETARVPMKRKGDYSHLSKRKHQITYLAQHAKANELELQNQWANNRMTKKQTQAKYGF